MASSRLPAKLDWQMAKMTNSDRARHMLETSLYADCEFLVGGDDEVKEVYLNILFSVCMQLNVSQFYDHVCVCSSLRLTESF